MIEKIIKKEQKNTKMHKNDTKKHKKSHQGWCEVAKKAKNLLLYTKKVILAAVWMMIAIASGMPISRKVIRKGSRKR